MKYIAMFLPQFHDCEYNSQWWGKGFTEWENVKRATPLFHGHQQPRIPADGYFDLNDIDEISRQTEQARQFGIDAFSIYHYWYCGKRPLSKPLDLILNNPRLDIEYSLCWANHSWTKSWKNRSGALDVLIEQTYENDQNSREQHFLFLSQVFSDRRYVTINGKPLFQIYMPEAIPECGEYLDELRKYIVKRIGLELHLSAMVKAWSRDWRFLNYFDSITFFQPTLALFNPTDVFGAKSKVNRKFLESRMRDSPKWVKRLLYNLQDILPDRHSVYPYDKTWDHLIKQYICALDISPLPIFPMAFVDFDNTPRYKRRAKLFRGFSVDVFEQKLYALSQCASSNSPDGIVFINAWNEWGEGMYLQPDIGGDFSRLTAVSNCKNRVVFPSGSR